MKDYDKDRWRIISSKVGNGFSAAACQAKADEIQAEEHKQQHESEQTSEDELSS